MIDQNHLGSFFAVAGELKFQRAARRLNMTQPPLSRQISMFAREIGAQLFDRTYRSVRLAAAGNDDV